MGPAKKFGIVTIVVGSVLAVAGIALTVNALWVLAGPVQGDQLFDTYYVLPSPWITLSVFGVGVVGDFVFWRQAKRFGDWSARVWRTHLLLTSALLALWLIASAQAETTQKVAIVVYATFPLMISLHGIALVTGAMILREAGNGGHAA